MALNQRRIEKFFGKLGIFIGSLFLVLGLAEGFSRLFFPKSHPLLAPYGFYDGEKVPRPYVMFGGRPGFRGLNSYGYAGDYPKTPKSPGQYRIFVLGGSTVAFGEPTIPEALAQEIHKNFGNKNIFVYNFGVASATSNEQLARVVFEVANLSPDMVIFYDGANDLSEKIGDPRPGYPFNFYFYESNPLLVRDIDDYPWALTTLYGSNLLRHVLSNFFVEKFLHLNELSQKEMRGSLSWTERRAEIYLQNILRTQKIAHGLGVEFVHFFQPLPIFQELFQKTAISHTADINEDILKKHFPQGIDPVLLVSKHVQETLKNSREVKSFDLSHIFDSTKDKVFMDWVHNYQVYNPYIAEKIYEKIEPLLLKKFSKLKPAALARHQEPAP